jgi:phosphate acetyltransferase
LPDAAAEVTALATLLDRFDRTTRVAFGDAGDARIQRGVEILGDAGVLQPVLVAPLPGTKVPSTVETVAVDDAEWSERCAAELERLRRSKGMTLDDARSAITDPLLFMALYTRLGGAAAGVAGSTSTSANVIRSGLLGLGTAQPGGRVCGCFLMQLGTKFMTYADSSVTPNPDADQLATIAALAADCHRAITGEEPRVAMLSFSSHGSAEHPDVDKVRQATKLVKDRRPDLCVDGEMQFDVAVVPEIGERKCPGSPVAGRANVMIFPDLDAGNIGYKITERLAGARAIGSIVLGLARPWIDLSRGCTAQDVVDAAVAAACMTNQVSEAVKE